MQTKRFFNLMTGLAVICGLLAVGVIGGTEVQAKVTITVQMFSGPEYDAMEPTAVYWNENYAEKTGIKVKAIALSRVGYFEKMQSQLVAGLKEPDIVHPFNMALGKLSSYLEPLNDYLKRDDIMTGPDGEKYNLDDMLKVALQTATAPDGSILALPKDMSEVHLYYRKDLIPQPPATWDEYMALAKKFTKSINPDSPTKYGAVMQGKYEKWTYCAALDNLWPNAYQIFKDGTNNKVIADYNPEWAKGFRVFEELSKAKVLYPGFDNTEYPEVSAALASGDVAMGMQWNANYFSLTNKEVSPKVYDKIMIGPPPGEKQADGSIKRAMYTQTICLALNKKSRNKEAAMKFLAWSTFGEGAILYAQKGGSSPIKQVWKAKDAAMPYPYLAEWVEKYGRPLPQHTDMSELVMIGSSWVQKVGIGRVTSEEAAKGMREEMIKFLKSR